MRMLVNTSRITVLLLFLFASNTVWAEAPRRELRIPEDASRILSLDPQIWTRFDSSLAMAKQGEMFFIHIGTQRWADAPPSSDIAVFDSVTGNAKSVHLESGCEVKPQWECESVLRAWKDELLVANGIHGLAALNWGTGQLQRTLDEPVFGLSIAGDIAYLAQGERGVGILDLRTFKIVERISVPELHLHRIAVGGDHVYVYAWPVPIDTDTGDKVGRVFEIDLKSHALKFYFGIDIRTSDFADLAYEAPGKIWISAYRGQIFGQFNLTTRDYTGVLEIKKSASSEPHVLGSPLIEGSKVYWPFLGDRTSIAEFDR